MPHALMSTHNNLLSLHSSLSLSLSHSDMKSNSLGLHGSLTALPAGRKSKKESMMVSGRQLQVMMVKPKESTPLGLPSTTQEKKAYNDNWFDRLAIHHLSLSVQATTGVRNAKKGYESLTEAASVVSRNFGAKGQQELVIQALKRAFPSSILSAIRAIVPQSEFGRLYYATFTTLFFKWLVGPCEVRESEFEGRSERNVVYIHKCRFLESTNCVGMCINLCKIPSQKFIHDSFGMPVHMAPNFEDMSCEMIFGQLPPTDDPALKQPCYQSLCIARNTHDINCSSG